MLPLDRFARFIEQNQLFGTADKVLAAVSGGMDSVLMAHLLKACGYQFGLAHCNFNLRGAEADADEQFTRQLAESLGTPFHNTRFDTSGYAAEQGISIQMAARELRYQWFADVALQHGYQVIALAHHQNDTIETILLNLTRGTGIAGLHGILPKNGNLVRPMLGFTRQEIDEIVRSNQVAYVEDSSNASTKYARNKIRLEVIPKLKELNPGLEETFGRNMKHFRQMEQLLEQSLDDLRQTIIQNNGDEVWLPIAAVKGLYPQQLLLAGLLAPYGFNDTAVNDIMASLDKHSGRVFESPSYQLVLDRDNLIITGLQKELPKAVMIHEGDHQADYHPYRLKVMHDGSALIIRDNPMAVSVDVEKLVYPLTLRNWQQSDFFYPLGMKTRQKLSDFFIHQKVPLHQKQQIPLLINGNGDIIWVAGYRPDERYKVSAQTKKVTIFELYKSHE